MAKLKYPLKSDIAFKLMMTRHADLLKNLISAMLCLDESSIEHFIITNPELEREHVEAKHCRLDLNMAIDGSIVDVEVQLRSEGNFKERAVYYLCRLHAGTLSKGQDYQMAPRTILIGILDFNLFVHESFHSQFYLMEHMRHEPFSDRLALHLFELRKLKGPLDKTDMLALWLRLIKAISTEELDEIDALGVSIMSKATEAVRDIQKDRKLSHLALRREIAEHDEAQALGNAERRGVEIGERRGIEIGERRALDFVVGQMYAAGSDIGHIAKMTGYTKQQISSILKKQQGQR